VTDEIAQKSLRIILGYNCLYQLFSIFEVLKRAVQVLTDASV